MTDPKSRVTDVATIQAMSNLIAEAGRFGGRRFPLLGELAAQVHTFYGEEKRLRFIRELHDLARALESRRSEDVQDARRSALSGRFRP